LIQEIISALTKIYEIKLKQRKKTAKGMGRMYEERKTPHK
jgi:hypothetical protein